MPTLAEDNALWEHMQRAHNFAYWTPKEVYEVYEESFREVHEYDHRTDAVGHSHPREP